MGEREARGKVESARKPYSAPRLIAYGDLQRLTKAKPGAMGEGTGQTPKTNCWIAEALYGIDDPRTLLLRTWLNGTFALTSVGSMVMALYSRFGRQIAKSAERSVLLRGVLRPLFDAGLARAFREVVHRIQ